MFLDRRGKAALLCSASKTLPRYPSFTSDATSVGSPLHPSMLATHAATLDAQIEPPPNAVLHAAELQACHSGNEIIGGVLERLAQAYNERYPLFPDAIFSEVVGPQEEFTSSSPADVVFHDYDLNRTVNTGEDEHQATPSPCYGHFSMPRPNTQPRPFETPRRIRSCPTRLNGTSPYHHSKRSPLNAFQRRRAVSFVRNEGQPTTAPIKHEAWWDEFIKEQGLEEKFDLNLDVMQSSSSPSPLSPTPLPSWKSASMTSRASVKRKTASLEPIEDFDDAGFEVEQEVECSVTVMTRASNSTRNRQLTDLSELGAELATASSSPLIEVEQDQECSFTLSRGARQTADVSTVNVVSSESAETPVIASPQECSSIVETQTSDSRSSRSAQPDTATATLPPFIGTVNLPDASSSVMSSSPIADTTFGPNALGVDLYAGHGTLQVQIEPELSHCQTHGLDMLVLAAFGSPLSKLRADSVVVDDGQEMMKSRTFRSASIPATMKLNYSEIELPTGASVLKPSPAPRALPQLTEEQAFEVKKELVQRDCSSSRLTPDPQRQSGTSMYRPFSVGSRELNNLLSLDEWQGSRSSRDELPAKRQRRPATKSRSVSLSKAEVEASSDQEMTSDAESCTSVKTKRMSRPTRKRWTQADCALLQSLDCSDNCTEEVICRITNSFNASPQKSVERTASAIQHKLVKMRALRKA